LLRRAAIIPVLPAILQGAIEARFGLKGEELALSLCFPLFFRRLMAAPQV
jgi:hypothetical protein